MTCIDDLIAAFRQWRTRRWIKSGRAMAYVICASFDNEPDAWERMDSTVVCNKTAGWYVDTRGAPECLVVRGTPFDYRWIPPLGCRRKIWSAYRRWDAPRADAAAKEKSAIMVKSVVRHLERIAAAGKAN